MVLRVSGAERRDGQGAIAEDIVREPREVGAVDAAAVGHDDGIEPGEQAAERLLFPGGGSAAASVS